MHIPTFKMPTIRQVWLLVQPDDYAFSIDLKDAYLHVPNVKHHCQLLWFVLQHRPYQWKVLSFLLATAPRVFPTLTKPILFLCYHKGLHVTLIISQFLPTPSVLARELELPCALFCLS